MEVSLIDFMGSDLSVVNAARVSFGKRKEYDSFKEVSYGPNKTTKIPNLDNSDIKLINFLAKNNHWSPFGHATLQFHIKAPMFVARQLGKHQVGLVWNEISRRYHDSEPEFYNPHNWRLRASNVKQGSSDETIEFDITEYNKSCLNTYNDLLAKNIAPEMARMVLPMNIMTEWWWSGSLASFSRICKLRLAKDSQWETRVIAQMISDECEKLFPVSWEALKNQFTKNE